MRFDDLFGVFILFLVICNDIFEFSVSGLWFFWRVMYFDEINVG